jgi:transposase
VLNDNEKAISIHQEILIAKDKSLEDINEVIFDKNVLITQKTDEITTLERYISYMTQQRFGASSEKLSPDHLGLLDEAELLSVDDEESTTQVPAHQRKQKRLSIPEHLPATDILHSLS